MSLQPGRLYGVIRNAMQRVLWPTNSTIYTPLSLGHLFQATSTRWSNCDVDVKTASSERLSSSGILARTDDTRCAQRHSIQFSNLLYACFNYCSAFAVDNLGSCSAFWVNHKRDSVAARIQTIRAPVVSEGYFTGHSYFSRRWGCYYWVLNCHVTCTYVYPLHGVHIESIFICTTITRLIRIFRESGSERVICSEKAVIIRSLLDDVLCAAGEN
mmetsp:Transcript_12972/g.24332  ORF Transcript_12972/g.24332 Transcript_12972/m.24332 type:complete len:214 (-) Transcript_12972:1180-1821(-)